MSYIGKHPTTPTTYYTYLEMRLKMGALKKTKIKIFIEMKQKKITPYQLEVVTLLFTTEVVRVSKIQSKLRCSYLKACELLDWCQANNLVSKELPREVHQDNVKELLQTHSKTEKTTWKRHGSNNEKTTKALN